MVITKKGFALHYMSIYFFDLFNCCIYLEGPDFPGGLPLFFPFGGVAFIGAGAHELLCTCASTCDDPPGAAPSLKLLFWDSWTNKIQHTYWHWQQQKTFTQKQHTNIITNSHMYCIKGKKWWSKRCTLTKAGALSFPNWWRWLWWSSISNNLAASLQLEASSTLKQQNHYVSY